MIRTAAAFFCVAFAVSAQIDDATRRLSRDIFRELIEINTTDSAGDNTAAARAMQKRFLDAGFPAADIKLLAPPDRPNKGNLIVRLHGRTGSTLKPIVILGHLDVVEAKREDWTTDPFQFVEKDSYFYGRGTQDIKQGDAALVTTMLRFKREGFVPSRDIILALTSDEEGGTANGVEWLLKNHRDLLDAAFVLNVDAGGVYMEKGKPVSVEVGATEKIYADFQLTVTNPGGHSSIPVADNAIYHLAEALARLSHTPFPAELNPVTKAYFEKVKPSETDPRSNALMHTTCVPTRLNAGHANNALPQTAQANVNCRILPGHSPEEIRLKLVEILADPKLQVRYANGADGKAYDHAPEAKGAPPSMPVPEVLKPLQVVADSLWPGAPVIVAMETGASDGKYFQALGIPTYGIGEFAVEKSDIRAHGKDERLPVDSFYQGVDFFYRYLKQVVR